MFLSQFMLFFTINLYTEEIKLIHRVQARQEGNGSVNDLGRFMIMVLPKGYCGTDSHGLVDNEEAGGTNEHPLTIVEKS